MAFADDEGDIVRDVLGEGEEGDVEMGQPQGHASGVAGGGGRAGTAKAGSSCRPGDSRGPTWRAYPARPGEGRSRGSRPRQRPGVGRGAHVRKRPVLWGRSFRRG